MEENCSPLANSLMVFDFFKFMLDIQYLRSGKDIFLLYLSRYNSFFLKLINPAPIEASIKVTENCNSRCITCDVWKNKFQQESTTQELENIFYQLKEIGVRMIGFTGGEPLLRNDIGELIKKAKKITGAQVYIVTNGILLKKKAREIIEAGADWVSLSLDGIEKTDEKIRGVPGHFKMVIEGIKKIQKIKKDFKINIGTTLLKENISEVPELIKFCQELKTTWTFNLLDNNLYFFQQIDEKNLKVSDLKLIDKIIDHLYKTKKELPKLFNLDNKSLEFARSYMKLENPDFSCVTGYLRVYIDSKLNVYSGCWVLPPIGNLKEEKLKNILSSKKYKERAQKMFYLKCPKCTCGYVENCMINNLPSTIKYMLPNVSFFTKYLKK